MDVLYIPQLDEDDGTGEWGSTSRYKIVSRVPSEGVVSLLDKAVTRIEIATADDLRVVIPPLVKGAVRDFFARLIITSDEIPEITFAAPTGETISFEDTDEDILTCEIGVNIFAFTETDEGVFIVNRKRIDIDQELSFDANGGDCSTVRKTFKLGAKYGTLPTATRTGYVFQGWFTDLEDGVIVTSNDVCKTSVTKLYAQWALYVDPYVDAICPAKNLTFFSSGNAVWFVDLEKFVSSPGSVRSGNIGDSQASSLTTTVNGPGTLSFKWKVSSEEDYDKLQLIIDGTTIVSDFSGNRDWTSYTRSITGAGAHTIEWKYMKDGSCSEGSDCGWVDDVVWTPAT